jgi:selenocysteine lyase/cysteine desulfurase
VRRFRASFLVSNGFKWLCAGYGVGILYVRPSWLVPELMPAVGWRSMADPEQLDPSGVRLLNDSCCGSLVSTRAAALELGCSSFPTIFAAGAAVDFISGIGIEQIERRVIQLGDLLVKSLTAAGFRVATLLSA